jgi:hypothetical protein
LGALGRQEFICESGSEHGSAEEEERRKEETHFPRVPESFFTYGERTHSTDDCETIESIEPSEKEGIETEAALEGVLLTLPCNIGKEANVAPGMIRRKVDISFRMEKGEETKSVSCAAIMYVCPSVRLNA